MKFPRLTFTRLCLWVCFFALGPGAAVAEKADRNKPMNIESDALRYDDLKQISIFTGRVILTKGTIVIRGDRLEVRQDPEGYQFGVVTAVPGELAFFRQKRDGVDEFIEGDGQTIEYDGKADTVKFIGKAVLRRLRGSTLADEVIGNVVKYNNLTDVFTVDGGTTQASASLPKGRVRAMLTPKTETTAPSISVSPVPVPGANLRISPLLPGEKK